MSPEAPDTLEERMAAREERLKRLRHGLSDEKRAALERRLRGATQAAPAQRLTIPRWSPPTEAPPEEGEPTSFAQERLWFLAQLDPESTAYNLPAAIRLEGALDVDALRRALAEVVRRHSTLRTTFASRDGQPVQVIAPADRASVPLSVVDLGPLAGRTAALETRRLAQAVAQRPFDLAAGPLFAAILLRESPVRSTLVVVLHHIITDAWSMGVLVREIAALYAAFVTGGSPALPELPLQYADYARWQRGWLTGAVLDEQLGYWRRQLAGLTPELALPRDRPRPAVLSGRGRRLGWQAGTELAGRLSGLAQKRGATLFMALLAVYEGLLGRLSGQNDVAVGSPVAGRSRVETQGLIGFFVNPLVLRLDLGGAPDFLTLLERARETTLGAFAHQEIPFERLVAELRPERAASRNPLFQAAFVLQNAPAETLELAGLTLASSQAATEAAMFDLALQAVEVVEGLEGFLEHSRDLFDDTTAARMVRCFTTLLAAATADPARRFDDLPLLAEEERHQLLCEWSGGPSPYPRDATIHGLFAEQARRAPDAIALTTLDGEQLSYAGLAARAGRLAERLRGWGIAPETPVALCLARSPRLVVALLGVLEAGGAYLPLDPSYPRERLALMLDDLRQENGGRPPLLLTEEGFAGLFGWFEEEGGLLVRLDAEGAPAGESETAPAPPTATVFPEHPAYILYTSGSTGRPKGVVVPHRGVVRLVRSLGEIRFAPDEVLLQLSTLSFDASTAEIWGALLNGSRLVLMPPGAPALSSLEAAIERHQVTLLMITPALFHQMIDDRLESLRPVRQILAGGDVVSAPHARRLLAALPDTRLFDCYGPTENTTFTCCGPLPAGVGAAALPPGAALPIGRPLPNTDVFVVWDEDRLASIGAVGELVTGGDGLARGYWRRPDLTAERFRPHPFAKIPGERVYRTGDRARFLADGRLDFQSRMDHQVKVSGFRIEPAEIEAALAAHPAAPEAVNAGAEPAETREPRTPEERLLAGIWAEVLGRERIGIDEDFFELGGHSLLATRVVSRVRDALGVELPLRRLFDAPTIAALAPHLAARREAEAGGTTVSPPPVPRDRALPLSFAQERLWFLSQLDPHSPAFNLSTAVRLEGALDVPALRRALAEVVWRQESLRTTFPSHGGQPAQVIARTRSGFAAALPVVDLGGLGAGRAEGETRRLAAVAGLRPFDLATGPLFVAVLLRESALRSTLVVTLHHIITDGWSMGVLVREIAALYGAFAAGRPAALPELPIQYADYARWQRGWLTGPVLDQQLAWWRRQLASLPPEISLPTDRPRPATPSGRGGRVSRHADAELTARLHGLAQEGSATLFMMLLAVLSGLLGRLAGQRDIAVGAPVAGRTQVETEGLIGFFINTLVLRLDLGGTPDFHALMARARDATLGAFAHQDLPFERLVAELRPERAAARNPLFQVAFVLQNAPAESLHLPGLTLAAVPAETESTLLDLALEAVETDDGLDVAFEYSTDLFDRPTVARLAGHFIHLAGALAAAPGTRLSDLELVSAAERHQILGEWNDTRAPFPGTTLLHQLFEAAAERAPEAVAAVCAGGELTYAELEARSNRLARLLRSLGPGGAGRGTPVGVWVERSFDLLTALLGILKAGGHYVALDDAWPAHRVESILAATGSPAIVVGGGLLAAVEEMRWRLPALSDVVCLAIAEAEPPAEPLDPESVRALWDYVAERAVDRVTAGGFLSAFTGLPFSEAEVDEYRDRVLALAMPWLRPQARVLEIGNGSGLLLWELASRVAHVTGVDPSALTQERNRELAAREGRGHVELLTGFAHEIDDLLDDGERFDLVLLASVVQFFPGPRYLERVVRQAFGRLAPGGAVLVADVPDARRREELRQAIEEHRGQAGAGGGAGVGRELSLDEDFFQDLGAALPEGAGISVQHRAQGFPNELRFRYDVLLTRGEAGPASIRARRKRLWTGWHVARSAAGRLPASATPDDAAYVIHTSGSTGEPKGIVVQHRSAANLIDWVNRTFEVGPEDRGLFVTSLAFDLSVYDIFGILAAGGTVHVATGEELEDPDRLVALLREGGITLWDSAPAALVRLAPLFPAEPDPASRLRLVLLSGDWIPVTLPDRVRQAFPQARVMALGGATEATVWSNWYPVGEVDPRWPSIPYGRPISNARYHVLDAGFTVCPIGVPGDLYIGGDCLCAGYTRPELTAAAFLPDPFGTRPGARLYRTGDRARYRVDGHLEFLGRLDQQVKIRGYRIELGEIEAALARHPRVREAVVLAREDGADGKRLVAYVVPAQETAPSPSELRDGLRGVLPEYMLPSAFMTLEELPVTANGKLDRAALPPPESTAEGGAGEAPRNPEEELLAGLWAEVLGRERVGMGEDFFEIGGHSLLATRVLSRVREVFGVELPLRRLFEARTVAALAPQLAAARREAQGEPPQAPPRPEPRDRELPLSFAQERLWFLDQLEPGSTAYNLSLPVALRGRLHLGALAAAVAELERRHEALRTRFPARDGRARQEIVEVRADGMPAVPAVDLTALPAPRRDAERGRLVAALAGHRFDLARGPLVQWTLLLVDAGGPEGVPAPESIFVIAQHHIITDGWSMGVMVRELATLYTGLATGRPGAGLLPQPLQYADFAIWQRELDLAPQLAYWRERLAGDLPALELPADRPRAAAGSHRGGSAALQLTPKLSARAGAASRRAGSTPFMTLLAAWKALLYRLSGQDDLLVGVPIAGRNRAEIEGTLGFFVNTLVLRSRLGGNPTFAALLAQVREAALGAYAHQDLPFERLVAELQPERDLDRTPLFQVFFNHVNFTRDPIVLPGLTIEPVATEPPPSKFDLTIYFTEHEDGYRFDLLYDAGLFHPVRIEEMLAQLEQLLARVLDDPELAVGIDDIPLVTPRAAAVLPDPAQPLAGGWLGGLAGEAVPVHELFARQARLDPARIAAVDEDGAWTRGALEAAANRLARDLVRSGHAPGDVVAIAAERRAALAWAVLGVLKAGCAFLLLDPEYPEARREAMARLGGARSVVRLTPIPGDEEPGAPPVSVGPDDPAYVAFTSGSTGEPKAILGPHAPLRHFLAWHAATFGLGPGDRFSLLSGLAHDPLLRDLLAPLVLGATLCVPPAAHLDNPERLLAWLAAERVTVAHLTPAFAQLLSQGGSPLPDLRFAFFGGDRLTTADVARLRRLAPKARVVNFYGATETPQAMGWFEVPEILEESGHPAPPLGTGIDGVQLLVRNPSGAQAGIGELGEIVIRTPFLARGYLGDEALTRERFLPDPAGARLYRTGDLGRYRPDGLVDFAGRADRQVKIRGYRIEPAEIEAFLAEVPEVGEVAVTVDAGGTSLVAFVVPRPDVVVRDGELRRRLAQRLPSYMVPSAILPLEQLPLTPNRKIDRRALLRRLEEERVETARAASVAPRDPIEEVVAGIWEEVLGPGRTGGRVGVHDSFFALGGHSLLATQVLSRLRQAFGIDMPLRRLFETPTVAGLASAVAALRTAHATPVPGAEPPPLEPRPAGAGPAPLSFAQESLWFFEQVTPGTAAYNMPVALRLLGPARVGTLAAGLAEIARRQDSLRTSFAEGPVQVIAPPDSISAAVLPLVDLTGLPPGRREDVARQLAAAEAALPFELIRGPLWRARLLRLDGEEHVLLLTAHHVICDGWSMGVLAAELSAFYEADAAGRAAQLPTLPVQYGDYADWQRRWLGGPAIEAQLDYWRRRLAGAPALLELPTDRPRPARRSHRGARIGWELPDSPAAALTTLARRHGATPFMLLLAAFQTLLARHSGQDDLVVGLSIAHRNRIELEPLIGFFVNMLALRGDLRGDPPFDRLLEQARGTTLDALDHQDLPFERLVAELRPERGLAHSPIFQVLCTLQNAPLEARLPGLDLVPFEMSGQVAHFDLTLSLATGRESGIGGYLEYDAELFDASTAHRLLGQFETLLAALADDPGRRLSELPLLGAGEVQQLAEWNDTAAPFPADRCLHDLLADRARRTPEAPAVISGDERLTFGALDAAAESLAARLRALGVGPDAVVALYLERSAALVVAVLAVLKAGGAYLPIDLADPRERIAWVLQDAGPQLAMTASGLAPKLPKDGPRIVCLDQPSESSASRPAPPPVLPEHLAYVIYTSGSTGRPKGTMIPHRSVVSYLSWAVRAYRVEEGGGAPVHTPLAFDLTVTSLFAPWLAGRPAHLVSEEEGVAALGGALAGAETGFSLVKLTPAHLPLLAEQPGAVAAGRTRALVIGGEALSGESLAAWREAAPATRVINEYGPTETVVGCCVYEAPAGEIGDGPVPIGRPIANARLYVVDRDLRPVPLGTPGELLIGGEGLARGYLRRPDLTAERFVPDALGNRLYRTGDLARRRADGVLEYLGRLDDQVKIRGFRVELGEVQAALASHSSLAAAAVVARPGRSGGKRLIAYVMPHSGEEAASASELRRHLKARLPEHMVPAAFVELPELPLTPNGKVDRKALPAPSEEQVARGLEPSPAQRPSPLAPLPPALTPARERGAPAQNLEEERGGEFPLSREGVSAGGRGARGEGLWEGETAAPRTPAEAILAGIWAQLLRLPSVGIHDNFFELGGDSILSLQVASRARAEGLRIKSRDLFRYQTVAELASHLAPAAEPAPAVEPSASVTTDIPLTPIQRWFFDLGHADPAHYNQTLLLRLRRPLAPRVLAAAASHLIERHDALRLRFEPLPAPGKGWRQRIAPPGPRASFTLIDLSRLPTPGAALEAAAGALQGSLDLADGPILRLAQFDLGTGDPGRLLVAIHHLAVDGVSWRILLEDLETACDQLERGEPVRLPAPTTPFRSWAERLAAAPPAPAGERTRTAPLPLDHPAPEIDLRRSARQLTLSLDETETTALVKKGRIDKILLEAVAAAWRRWTGSPSLLVDVEGHGRDALGEDEGLDVSRTVGWFTTITPVLLGPGDAPRGVSTVEGALPAAPLLFNYFGQLDSALSIGSRFSPAPEPAGAHVSPRNRRSHPLQLDAAIEGGRLHLTWSYSLALHRPETIKRLAEDTRRELLGGEAQYLLTPMQQGILFHSRLAATPELYVAQVHFALQGLLDLAAFRGAWQQVIDRHDILRADFQWVGLDHPRQTVRRHVEAPLTVLDWRGAGTDERSTRLAELLRADRRHGFDTGQAPLLRVTLVRLAEDEHQMILSFHHLLLDGWSMPVLFGELLHVYEALRAGRRPELPPVRPFHDYIDWLARQDAAAPEPAEAFWRRELAGFTAPTPLPLEARPEAGHPATADYTRRFHLLTAEETAALHRLTRRGRLTLGSLVQGAWAFLLSRYAATGDVLFGATSSGRPPELEGAETMLGLFIATLPVRVAVRGEAPLLPWLGEIQQHLARLREMEHTPLAEIQRWSEVPRGLALFDSLVVFENYPIDPGHGTAPGDGDGSLRIRGLGALQNTNYPLTLVGAMREESLLLRLAFDASRFTVPPVERALAHLATLLRALADHADAGDGPPLGDLPILDPAERHQLLHEWNDTGRAPVIGPPLHRLFEARAAAAPGAKALLLDDLELTYAEVDARANRLAADLRRRGVGPETLVALSLPRSAELPIAMLAVWKAGGAFLPLDPSYPRERLDFMLADSRAHLLLTGSDLPDLSGGEPLESADPDPGSLAYVIYTSGSTGTPKGVMIEHRGLANLVREQIEAFGITPESRVLQLASASFDASVSEIWTAWAAGAALVMLPEGALAADAGLVRRLREQAVSVVTFPPSLLAALPYEELPALATLVVAGEAANEAVLARWAPGRQRVLNAYGPTELTVCATMEPYHPGRTSEPLLGRPIANTRIRLLGAQQLPVPIGAVGEICLTGVGLARGYLARPDLTAAGFVPDPWSDMPGGRLYRTGDLARWAADGKLAFLGRRDAQVKVRGVRIETGEIEAALARHPDVRACAVVARRDKSGQGRLVAYVVAASPVPPSDLRTFLQRILPDSMVPGHFVELPELPRMPSGKLDRRALPDPEITARGHSAPPRTHLERYLAGLWSEILGVADIGLDDDFFQLGGHSLSGAALVGRLQQDLGEIVHVVVMYDAPTVGALAAYLAGHYPEAVSRLLGGAPATGTPVSGPIGAPEIAELRRIVAQRSRSVRAAQPSPRNPPALFVLSPPRSGSTLLRVMLAGHPQLFAPPELELLSFETLAERRAAFAGRNSFWLEGVVRAMMEIRRCDAADAEALVAALEAEGATTQELYRRLQKWIVPRLLVDKTPSYALDPEALARAERVFDGARYVHLLRHPLAMIRSFEEARLDQVFFRFPHRFSRRQLAELIWSVSEENILGFLAGIEPERQYPLRYEELVERPEEELRRLCQWLEIDFHPAMARPYENKAARMTDGIHPWSRMLGDVKFHDHRAVDPSAAHRWRTEMQGHVLGRPTAELAARLGYGEPAAPTPSAALVPLQPRGARPPLICIHPAGGDVLCYRDLAQALGDDRPVYGLQAQGLAPGETPLAGMDEIVERSLAALLEAFPEGPYNLLGWSFGGLVAYELARRLTATGREVAILAILDAGPTEANLTGEPAPEPRYDEAHLLATAFQSAFPVTAEEIRALPEGNRLALLFTRAAEEGRLPPGVDLAHAERLLATFQANQRAARTWRPAPYPGGRITLLRAAGPPTTPDPEPARPLRDPLLGWGRLAATVEVHQVPGEHETMVDPPHVEALAERLRRCW